MGGNDDRKGWPLWVSVGLWGVPSREMAWAFVWLSVVLALGCIGYGFVNPWLFSGSLFFLAALWYYGAIRWVDQHGRWS